MILGALCLGGGLFGMSRAELNRNQERRNQELIDATYDAGGSYDNDGGGDSCCDGGSSYSDGGSDE
jgi:hypothetical protein